MSTLTYQSHPKPGKRHGFSTKNGSSYLMVGYTENMGSRKPGVSCQWTMTGQEGTIRMIWVDLVAVLHVNFGTWSEINKRFPFKKRSFLPLLDQINPENIRFGSNTTILPIKTLNSNKLPITTNNPNLQNPVFHLFFGPFQIPGLPEIPCSASRLNFSWDTRKCHRNIRNEGVDYAMLLHAC